MENTCYIDSILILLFKIFSEQPTRKVDVTTSFTLAYSFFELMSNFLNSDQNTTFKSFLDTCKKLGIYTGEQDCALLFLENLVSLLFKEKCVVSKQFLETFCIKTLLNGPEIKNKVLGNKYELSLVFIGSTRSRKLNLTYRDKDKPANVLSFPLTKSSGEIFIDLNKTKTFSTLHLFIHGLLHLKGMQHGGKMESEEQRLLKLFNGQTHFRRHRHR